MENSNQTSVRKFILLRLSDVFCVETILSLIFFVMYMMTLFGNLLLIIVVRVNSCLQTPMYFFLCNLSLTDICFSSTVVPKILINTISRDTSISFLECAVQSYFHFSFGATECLILTMMAFDRYVAICKPLRYNMIMTHQFCLNISVACWFLGFGSSFILTLFTFQLQYCKSNFINHFFCEIPPLLRLSCSDVWLTELTEYIIATLFALGTFLLILVSYLFITISVFKIHSVQKRQKVFSTCTTHITVVSLYYGTIMFMHLRPRSSYSAEQDKAVSVIYTVVTPMLNPIIYSIRNKDIKENFGRSMRSNIVQC